MQSSYDGSSPSRSAALMPGAAAVDVVEPHHRVLAVRRRAHPQVDHQVQDRPAGAVDVLRLTRGHVGEMNSAQDTAAGDGVVGLHRGEGAADDVGELVAAEPLEEGAPVVAVRPGDTEVRVRDLERRNVHGVTLARRYSGRTRERRWSGFV